MKSTLCRCGDPVTTHFNATKTRGWSCFRPGCKCDCFDPAPAPPAVRDDTELEAYRRAAIKNLFRELEGKWDE